MKNQYFLLYTLCFASIMHTLHAKPRNKKKKEKCIEKLSDDALLDAAIAQNKKSQENRPLSSFAPTSVSQKYYKQARRERRIAILNAL